MSHTPGPWQPVTFTDPMGVTAPDFSDICQMGNEEESVDDMDEERMSELKADAYLIAAAPDMFMAIKEYLDWGPMTGSDRDLHENAFRAAIAKAEGRA